MHSYYYLKFYASLKCRSPLTSTDTRTISQSTRTPNSPPTTHAGSPPLSTSFTRGAQGPDQHGDDWDSQLEVTTLLSPVTCFLHFISKLKGTFLTEILVNFLVLLSFSCPLTRERERSRKLASTKKLTKITVRNVPPSNVYVFHPSDKSTRTNTRVL
jgi:hypothetical protein